MLQAKISVSPLIKLNVLNSWEGGDLGGLLTAFIRELQREDLRSTRPNDYIYKTHFS